MGLGKTLGFILDHPLNRGRPIAALARFVGWQFQSRLKDEVIVDWIEGVKLAARHGMTGVTGNIYCGLHEFEDMSFFLHLLRPQDTFVDVGANVGSYTLLASGACGARSIAVEPDAGTIRHLRRNIAINRLESLVDIRETAIGSANGTIAFTVGADTMNRVAQEGDHEVQSVAVTSLDELLGSEAPTAIKLDIEGFEAEALKGAQATLSNPALHAIEMETVDPYCEEQLTGNGFSRYAYNPRARSLEEVQSGRSANSLFVRNEAEVIERLKSAPVRQCMWAHV